MAQGGNSKHFANNSEALYASVSIASAGAKTIIASVNNNGIAVLGVCLSVQANTGSNDATIYLASTNSVNLGPLYIGTFGPNATAVEAVYLDFHDNPVCPLFQGEAFLINTAGNVANIGGFVQYIQGNF